MQLKLKIHTINKCTSQPRTPQTNIIPFAGYDQIPIDSMQGLEIGSGFGMDMDIGETEGAGAASADLAFPEPPHDNNNVAAWYDTDL